MRESIRWSLLGIFIAAMLGSVACRPPADEEAMAQLQQEIEDLKAEQNQIQASLKGTLDELDAFKRKVETMLATRPGGGTAQTQQIEARLKALESQIATGAAGNRNSKARPTEISPLEPTEALPTTGPASGLRPLGGTQQRTTPRVAATPRPAAEESAPVGEYYQAREGDTFDSIAKMYGITTEDLRKANRLPADRPLRAGQQYWVPAKRPGSKN